MLKKTKEKGLSPKNEFGDPDPTPYEAVKRIVEDEKKQMIEMKKSEKDY